MASADQQVPLSVVARQLAWRHRVLDSLVQLSAGLEVGALTTLQLHWAAGDLARLIAAQALGWSGCALAQFLGVERLCHRAVATRGERGGAPARAQLRRACGVIGRLGAALGYGGAALSSSSGAWLCAHVLGWGLLPSSTALAAQSAEWEDYWGVGFSQRAAVNSVQLLMNFKLAHRTRSKQ
eukprot:SAG11_NODE_1932_length_4043_cov_4.892748_4_plen_182_part_00